MGAETVTLLGASGSVGRNALDVLAQHRERYRIHALTGNTDVETLLTQTLEWQPECVVMADAEAARSLRDRLNDTAFRGDVLSGSDALVEVASDAAVDIVIGAIVGAAGLLPALAAAQSGKRLLLANKEALVMSGELLTGAARASGASVIPLDSEHNAIFQSLPTDFVRQPRAPQSFGIKKIWLTASGGPFRGLTKAQLSVVSRQQALQHPNWSMGPKISVDSATLMNKGLEVIEASYLFALPAEQIDVVVHPQSVVHSMVGYIDGSVIAQLGVPDMRTPIAHALAWPERLQTSVAELDLCALGDLQFEKPDMDTFRCLALAYSALESGGTAPLILNAANEVAVSLFLQDRVSFLQLVEIVEETLQQANIGTADDLETILNADIIARQSAQRIFEGLN